MYVCVCVCVCVCVTIQHKNWSDSCLVHLFTHQGEGVCVCVDVDKARKKRVMICTNKQFNSQLHRFTVLDLLLCVRASVSTLIFQKNLRSRFQFVTQQM